MKVVHFDSGLGNQMLAYVEYLAIKKMNPDDEFYIETIIYDIPEAEETIKQWNGYELDRIFGIDLPNVKELFTKEQWEQVIQDVKKSEFWRHDWSYPEAISSALNMHGNLSLRNLCKSKHKDTYDDRPFWRRKLTSFLSTDLGYNCKRILISVFPQKRINKYSDPQRLFFKSNSDDYCGFTLLFRFRNNDIERLDKEIREAFIFPPIDDSNKETLNSIKSSESVALHIRRGDMLCDTKKYYTGGFFRRAVRYIRRKVSNPIFFVFCDPDSIEWTKNNYKILGLKENDHVNFIYWNKGLDSFRDMQLMASCKHAIITDSSFGWWGAYLNSNPDKITISPEVEINSTYHC